jgi:hypothetical protein
VGSKIAAYNEAGTSPKFNSSGLVLNFEMFTDAAGTTPGTWRDAKNTADPIWIA